MRDFYDYVSAGKNRVEGWFSRVDSQLFYELLSHQNEKRVDGAVAEIGLHHGKSFIALCLGLAEAQKAYGIDVFEAQSLNLDGSGRGAKEKVHRNLGRFGVDPSRVVLDSRSSDAVTAADILAGVGRVRFFSIDGGHWRQVVCNDLHLAEQVLVDEGIIALDDFLRPEWPDVSLGFFDWYARRSKDLTPFAIGHNKLYLCRENLVSDLTKLLEHSGFLKHFLAKRYNFLGNDVLIFQTYQLTEWGIKKRIKEYLKLYQPDFYVRCRRMLG